MATLPVSTVHQHPSFPTATQPAHVSTLFDGTPDARTGNTPYNVIVRSAGDVYFAVHAQKLLSASRNRFANLLTANSTPTTARPAQITVREPADVLNVVLHTIYGLSADAYRPSLQCVRAALQALEKYDVTPLERYTTTNAPLFNTILSLATAHPFETYALVSQHKLENLAVAVSSRTLLSRMHTMSSEVANSTDVVYLQRLYGLHEARREGMKVISASPVLHERRPNCSDEAQHETWLDFQFACGKLFMEAPAITREQVETGLNACVDAAVCNECKANLAAERGKILEGFDALRTTI